MLVLSANIEIIADKTWSFDKVTSVEVELDGESLTDTCTIKYVIQPNYRTNADGQIEVGNYFVTAGKIEQRNAVD